MILNVFNTQENFENALEKPKPFFGIIIALIAGILMGIGGYLVIGNYLIILGQIIGNLIQFVLLSLILSFLGVAFDKKNKKHTKESLSGTMTIVGQIWIWVVLSGIIAMISVLFPLNIVVSIMFGLAVLVAAIILYQVYVAIKTVTGSDRAIIAWVLVIALYSLAFYAIKLFLA